MKYLGVAAVLVASLLHRVRGPDAEETLRMLAAFAKQELAAATTAADRTAAEDRIASKAKAAVEGVDPAKVDDKEGYAWAQLFHMARMIPPATLAVKRFLATDDRAHGFAAECLLMNLYVEQQRADDALTILDSLHPSSPDDCRMLVSEAVGMVGAIVKKNGADAAIRELDRVQAQAVLHGRDPSAVAQNDEMFYDLAHARAELLQEAARPTEALKALDDGVARLPADSKESIRLKTYRNQLTIVGAAAPELTVGKGYGEYPGISAWKGKVVLVDFFAHWSAPCKALFPDLVKLYADLHPKGLEIVGYTTYYGYLGLDKALSQDEEYEKMDAFIKDRNIPWATEFGDRSGFLNYGVTAVPYAVVIGKDGTVRDLRIGDDLGGLPQLREAIEGLLAE